MPNKVEIVSLGGLPLGIDYSDLSAHISMPRNKLLSNVFFRLELIEAYGTGIERMRNSYNDSGTQPTIRITPNTFTVELPNRNAPRPELANEADSDVEVRSILGDGKARSRKEIQDELGVSQSTAIRLLKELETQGHVKRVGSGKNTRYAITR
jgi:ATP-dependent DNA helicase RecG